ncbi:hypothetical protein [Methanobacterium aggregans]|nr:hypothetical protein [Methanobacterium aggregans]MBP2045153.1 hypothetical protein [Methanobacterium aggregans]
MNLLIESLITWFLWECTDENTVEIGYIHENEDEHGLIFQIN